MRTQGRKSVDWYILLSTLSLLAFVVAYFYWAGVRIGGGSSYGGNTGEDYLIATPGQRVIDGSGGSYPGVDDYSLATPTPGAAPTATPFPTATSPIDAVATMPVSLLTTYYRSPSEFCYGCDVYKMNVKFTHYEPWLGSINCWDFHDDYCWSKMAADVAWEPFIGIAAACPPWKSVV